jgi:hypothetical protein
VVLGRRRAHRILRKDDRIVVLPGFPRGLDSHFKCDTELRGEGLDWCFEAEALSGC